MKIVVLVPSAEYKNNAGARIRYGRLEAFVVEQGWSLSLESVAHFDPRSASCDVLIISKCHDARAIVAAHLLRSKGAKVGVDLFDDYFSQTDDSRLNRYRAWLGQLLGLCNFALCSTRQMAEVVRTYRPDLPLHVVNDPAPECGTEKLTGLLAEKLSKARADGLVRACWFGVGDNPNFPIGLSDLAAFSPHLRFLEQQTGAIQLTVLTNERALSSAGITRIQQLPFKADIQLWSEDKEAELLRDSLLCFLPVNAQPFSKAKSLNRAITALCSGCQVLSVGYPLYASLEPLTYRDVDGLATDLQSGNLRLSHSSLPVLRSKLAELASPERETSKLIRFLAQMADDVNARAQERPIYLVNGRATNGAAHKMAQATGGLSFGTPFTDGSLEFDALFQAGGGGELILLVSDKALSRVRPDKSDDVLHFGKIRGRTFWHVRQSADEGRGLEWSMPSLSLQLALYPSLMRRIVERIGEVFVPGQTIISETSPIPFQTTWPVAL